MEAGELKDFSFMEDLKGVHTCLLHKAVLKNGEMFEGFDDLERLILYQVEMDEEDAAVIVEGILSLPSLEYFHIEGKTAWYITEEQWEKWRELYDGKIVLSRD